MIKKIVSYLLIAALCSNQGALAQQLTVAKPASMAAPAEPVKRTGFNQFKAKLKEIANVPAHEVRFLYNWVGKKYNGIATSEKDDKHAKRILGGALAVTVIASLGLYVAHQYHQKHKAVPAKKQTKSNTTITRSPEQATEDLFDAVYHNDPAKVENALNAGANHNAQDDNDNTPLHRAISHLKDSRQAKQKNGNDQTNTLNIVKLLINRPNIDLNVTNEDGNTPLHIAAYRGNLDAINLLLKQTIDINALNNQNETPLDLALEQAMVIYNGPTNIHDQSSYNNDPENVAFVKALRAKSAKTAKELNQ